MRYELGVGSVIWRDGGQLCLGLGELLQPLHDIVERDRGDCKIISIELDLKSKTVVAEATKARRPRTSYIAVFVCNIIRIFFLMFDRTLFPSCARRQYN